MPALVSARARRAALAALSLVIAVLPSPAFGVGAQPIQVPGVPSVLEAQGRRVDATIPLLRSGGLESAIRAGATWGQLDLPRARATSIAPTASLPALVQELAGVVTAASANVSAAMPAPARVVALRGQADRLLERWDQPSSSPSSLEELSSRLRAAVNATIPTDVLVGSALNVGHAVDAALPGLLEAAGPASGERVLGCDVLDRAPVVCVGGEGTNVYTKDYALQIDLGGNDEYRNAPGTADMLGQPIDEVSEVGPGGNGLPVAVAIDLSGDDAYAATTPSESGASVAQGSALAGVGMLLDVEGDDTYSVTRTAPDGEAIGQGYAEAGVAVFDDRSGNDQYAISDNELGPLSIAGEHVHPQASARGRGVSRLGGLVVVLDRDGNDSSEITARPPQIETDQVVRVGPADAWGYGMGDSGAAAVFADLAGNDDFALDASVEMEPGTEWKTLGADNGTWPDAAVFGMGWAVAGSALTVSSDGASDWTATADVQAEQTKIARAYVLAVAGLGAAAFEDLGGDDVYRVRVSGRRVASRSVGEGCGCDQVAARGVDARSDTTLDDPSFAQTMAHAIVGGVATMRDRGGQDTYDALVESIASAHSNVGSSGPGAPESIAEANASGATLRGQGFASSDGFGLLEDAAGDDHYLAATNVSATADATGGRSQHATASAHVSELMAQGVIWGHSEEEVAELRDLGGEDEYTSVATMSVTPPPPPPESGFVPTIASQGAIFHSGGHAVFVDVGGSDRFSSVPARPACEGTRGGQYWLDCPPYSEGRGIGINV